MVAALGRAGPSESEKFHCPTRCLAIAPSPPPRSAPGTVYELPPPSQVSASARGPGRVAGGSGRMERRMKGGYLDQRVPYTFCSVSASPASTPAPAPHPAPTLPTVPSRGVSVGSRAA